MSRPWIAALLSVLVVGTSSAFVVERMIRRVPATPIAPAKTVETPAEPLPTFELTFSTKNHDIGRIEGLAKHTFTYTNRSAKAIRIRDPKPSCTCTIANPEPSILQPGETGRLAVAVDPSRFARGRHQQTVALEYEGAEIRKTELTLRFENRPEVVIPERVEVTGMEGRPASAIFTTLNYRDKPFVIKGIRTSSPDLPVAILERPTAYLPGWQHRLQATYRSTKAPGTHRETILIETDDPARPTISLPFSAQINRRLRVVPQTVRLRVLPGSTDAVGKLFASDAEGDVLKDQAIESSHPNLRARIVSEDDSRCEIEVRWTPTGGQLKTPLSLRLEFSKPRKEVVCVPVVP